LQAQPAPWDSEVSRILGVWSCGASGMGPRTVGSGWSTMGACARRT